MNRAVGWIAAFALLALALAPASVSALTITFDNLATTGDAVSYGGSPFPIQGYTFVATVGTQFSLDPAYDSSNAPPNNTDFQTFEGGPSWTMSAAAPFAFVSLRAAPIYDDPAGTVTVTGHLSGGGTVVQVFNLPSGNPNAQWATYVLPGGFTNLTSVDFVYSGQYIGIDDVVVSDQGPAKPIPALAPSWLAALSLLLAAASVVVLARRKRA